MHLNSPWIWCAVPATAMRATRNTRPASHLCRRQCQGLHLQHSLSQQELQEAPWWQHPAEGQKQLSAPYPVSTATTSLRCHHPTCTVSTVPQRAPHKPGLGICKTQHHSINSLTCQEHLRGTDLRHKFKLHCTEISTSGHLNFDSYSVCVCPFHNNYTFGPYLDLSADICIPFSLLSREGYGANPTCSASERKTFCCETHLHWHSFYAIQILALRWLAVDINLWDFKRCWLTDAQAGWRRYIKFCK